MDKQNECCGNGYTTKTMFNVISIKIAMTFFIEKEKSIFKFRWMPKRPQIAKVTASV
jgi:hypothetical protein